MKTTHTLLATCSLLAFSSFFTGCAGEDASQPIAGDPIAAHGQETEENATSDALSTFLRGGDFHFALRDSEILGAVKKDCAEEASKSNAEAREAETTACVAAIQEQADGEGVQITPLGAGRIRYLSYFTKDGQRQTHLLAEMSAEASDEGMVRLTDIKSLEGPELPPGARVLVDVVGTDTIAMDKNPMGHPRTGGRRLVYHLEAR